MPHCGKTSYGCWFKDFTAEELDESEAMALATIQRDADLNWFAQPGDGKSPGVIMRDTGGNESILYDAMDVDDLDPDRPVPDEPMFAGDWYKASQEEKDEHLAKSEKFRKEYIKAHPDFPTLPKSPPFPRSWGELSEEDKQKYVIGCEKFKEEYFKHHSDIVFVGHHHPGFLMRLVRMARRNLSPSIPKGTVIHDDDCVGLPGCSCKRTKA
ncbi:MAG: hypothetical protein A3B23_00780 [Candidatus Colwellbacteria bacterium RIFCSPLOWO2_01_FULL_48_10]|uniref:Uncharacterized protein n=2 Tax=Bacteria candidate phyla TaxID=1783234 RepID=A0A1F5NZ04_9BACT|nr:MAG: hypothetical protein A2846_03420 [Candidatus Doudnabacteria bacterium RIFCSPHIGHO2_01_FULL_49_9]OGY59718.1 MAG: hypothetical protein A3B23_00780 [Candidatus Colwellbacteria bacterium RIFCSPLOWO2_01_FULL_48_10]